MYDFLYNIVKQIRDLRIFSNKKLSTFQVKITHNPRIARVEPHSDVFSPERRLRSPTIKIGWVAPRNVFSAGNF